MIVDLRGSAIEALGATLDAALAALIAEAKATRAVIDAGYDVLHQAKIRHGRAPTLDTRRTVEQTRRVIVAAEARVPALIAALERAESAFAAVGAAEARLAAEWRRLPRPANDRAPD